MVKAILAGDTTPRGPFSRLGWIGDAFGWMQEILGNSIKFTGEVLQYNATGNKAALTLLGLLGEPGALQAKFLTEVSAP